MIFACAKDKEVSDTKARRTSKIFRFVGRAHLTFFPKYQHKFSKCDKNFLVKAPLQQTAPFRWWDSQPEAVIDQAVDECLFDGLIHPLNFSAF